MKTILVDRFDSTDFNTTITFDVVNCMINGTCSSFIVRLKWYCDLEIKGGVVSARFHPPGVSKVNEEIDTDQLLVKI